MATACSLCGILTAVAAFLFGLSFFTYLGYGLLMSWCRRPQNLKKKYKNAQWALVTGASSGIGLAVARRLAEQGFNIVIVAIQDKLLDEVVKSFREEFKGQEFRQVGVNLASTEFMTPILAATKDITPQVVISNAGYIVTGFYTARKLEDQVANFNCNAGCAVPIAHHFVKKLQDAKLPGCVVFTSSPAGFMACPFSAMYGATKAFLSNFATSLAAEVAVDGIDVMVVHPSPVQSNFYANTHKLDALEMFRKTGKAPNVVTDSLFATVGRAVVCDQGYYSITLRIVLKLIDGNFLAEMVRRFAHTMKDFKSMRGKQ